MNQKVLNNQPIDRLGYNYLDVLAFVIPLTQAIKFESVGIVYGTDIAYSMLLLFLWFSSPVIVWPKEMRTAVILLAVWLLGAVFSDIFISTSFDNIIRGWSKIIIFGVIICATYLLVKDNLRRMVILLAGGAVGTIIEISFDPSELASFDPWKFGVGNSVTILALCFVVMFFQRNIFGKIIGVGVILALSLFSLEMGVRSLFGETFITTVFTAIKIAFDFSLRYVTMRRFVLVGLLMLFAAQGSILLYELAVRNGLLGLSAQDIYQADASGDVGVLIGGRPESFVSSQAIIDSPVIGHGSWAEDPYYVSMYADILESKGIKISGDIFANLNIPSHSHLLGSWVESGVMGALFWIWVLIICVRAFYSLTNLRTPLTALIAFILISLVWDVLFSPFGAFMRFVDAPKICFALMVIRQQKRTRENYIRYGHGFDDPISGPIRPTI